MCKMTYSRNYPHYITYISNRLGAFLWMGWDEIAHRKTGRQAVKKDASAPSTAAEREPRQDHQEKRKTRESLG